MRKLIKQSFFLVLTFCLIFIWTDGAFFDHSTFHSDGCSQNQSSDFSGNNEHSDNHSGFDTMFFCDTRLNVNNPQRNVDLLPIINLPIKNFYNSSIWQPPKKA
jgi:hypothetical protein